MKYLVLDMETYDPYIDRKLGAGWVYKLNVPNSDFKALGAGIRTHQGLYKYITDWTELASYIDSHDSIICHNAPYDIGVLLSLGIGVKNKTIIDTIILAKLFHNDLMNYNLDALSKKYLQSQKNSGNLVQDVQTRNETFENPELAKIITNDKKLEKWIKTHMDFMQEHFFESIKEYCLKDVELTWGLFKKFDCIVEDTDTINRFSNVIKACLKMRKHGIRIDLDKARKTHLFLLPLIAQAHKKVYEIAGEQFNLSSCKDMPRIFDKLKIQYQRSKKGNPSITTKFLEMIKHPIGKAIIEAKKLKKFDSDFICKIIEMQKWTSANGDSAAYGRIFPNLTILGAVKTGRFSSNSPNVQQVPARDAVYGRMCREIFVPEEGQQWVKLDWQNQEGRFQIHYAHRLKCKGIQEFVNCYNENPSFDMHQKIADMAGITRTQAKTINHGIGFGMGIKKLCVSLGVSEIEGTQIIEQFHEMVPYLKEFMQKCIKLMQTNNFIPTFHGRKLFNDRFINDDGKEETRDYRAISKLIQGSAADQMLEAISKAYEHNLPLLMTVHDEVDMSISSIEQAEHMQQIMSDCVKLDVPMVAELTMGNDWGEASFGKVLTEKQKESII
jgi:DNA polymerase I-like protein with 3'-5' exonuclease and polymerase domains